MVLRLANVSFSRHDLKMMFNTQKCVIDNELLSLDVGLAVKELLQIRHGLGIASISKREDKRNNFTLIVGSASSSTYRILLIS